MIKLEVLLLSCSRDRDFWEGWGTGAAVTGEDLGSAFSEELHSAS